MSRTVSLVDSVLDRIAVLVAREPMLALFPTSVQSFHAERTKRRSNVVRVAHDCGQVSVKNLSRAC
jgi:hypothetical protein